MDRFKNILVVVDSSRTSHPEVERALKLAGRGNAKLHLVDVVRDISLTVRLLSHEYSHLQDLLMQEKQAAIDNLVAHCQSHGVEATGEIAHGTSSAKTLEIATRDRVDLIIRIAKGQRSLQSGTLGTSAQKLIRRLPCPLWLIRPEREPATKKIIACVDATPNNEAHANLNQHILSTATELVKEERGTLIVAHVWNVYGAEMLRSRLPQSEFESLMSHNRKQHQASFESLLKEFGLHATGPEARMVEGEPSLAIPDLCAREDPDLLICGTVARHGLAGIMLGNTAERIVSRVDCSVLALTPAPLTASA
jgi:universal stress protein E